ncbi:MAG: hypothetical protein KAJ03_05370 [Gammaproteobacteria bacterium]|nr:hypothetical protein [Gammaproteobacteria bacterium]
MAKVSLAALQDLQSLKFPGSAELAKDLLKFLDSLRPSWGANTMQGNASGTTIGAQSTYVLAAGTFVPGSSSADMTMTAAGRFTYSGAGPIRGVLRGGIGILCGTASQIVSVAVAKNGTVIASTEISAFATTVSQPVALPVMGEVDMVATDYLELFVTNDSAANDVTVVDASLLFESIVV